MPTAPRYTITQKQVAAAAGVSQPVVARVFSGHPDVAPATKARVEQAALELGYTSHSNASARALVARRHGVASKTGVVAVLYEGLGIVGSLRNNPFFVPLFSGIDSEAERQDLDACLFPVRASRLPRMIEEQLVDGVICVEWSHPVQELAHLGLPMVAIDFAAPSMISLQPDHCEGTRLATRHLIELGHQHVAYLSFDLGAASAQMRLRGYQQALVHAGLPYDETLVIYSPPRQEREAGSVATRALLKRRRDWTGLVCYNDILAMGAVTALQEASLSVPEDVSVVGFDDISQLHDFEPSLTSIAFDREAMGRRAVDLINGWSSEDVEKLKQPQFFPVELKVRQSTRALTA